MAANNAGYPAWSPDSKKIAYASNGYLRVINADGTGDHRVGSDYSISHPGWSPDGSKIVYAVYSGYKYQLYSISSSGNESTSSTQLTSVGTNYVDESPSYSPDGTKIVFDSNRAHYPYYDIYTMNADGTGITNLTKATGSVSDTLPVYAGGGGLIYYTSNADGSGKYKPYAIASSGGTGFKESESAVGYIAVQQPALPTIPLSGAHYVALGDSVASGEGINYGWTWKTGSPYGEWIGGTTSPEWMTDPYSSDHQHCHQSTGGYPILLRLHLSISNSTFWDYACTGASAESGILKIEKFSDSTETSAAQLGSKTYSTVNEDYDKDTPELVTLTLGADDVQFNEFIEACYDLAASVECNNATANTEVANDLSKEKKNLESVLSEIEERGKIAGKMPLVVVTDYYNPWPATYDSSCPDLSLDGGVISISSSNMSWLVQQEERLNQNIRQVASGYGNVVFVALDNTMSSHTMCSSSPWVYGISIETAENKWFGADSPAPPHPTEVGQEKIAQQIESLIG